MSLYGLLGQLESRTVLDTMTKEVVGINLPKIAVTRNNTERLDVAFSEIGNTMASFGAGGLLNAGLNKTFAKAQRAGNQWAVLGRSAALYSTIFSLMWAMPFIRNYLTAKRTGHTTFTQVIGANGASQGNQQADLASALADYKHKTLSILGLGAAGTLLAIGGSKLAIAKGLGRNLLEALHKSPKLAGNLLLKDGSFSNFSGLKALLFWGVPAYGGWIHAARDPYEKKEQLLKFASFMACFSGPQLLFDRHFKSKFDHLLPQGVNATYKGITQALKKETDTATRQKLTQALKAWQNKSLGGLLTSVVLLGTMPPLMNIVLTKRRLARDTSQGATPMLNAFASPNGNLQRATFSQWGQRPQSLTAHT